MRYDTEEKNGLIVVNISEKRLSLDVLNTVYKDAIEEIVSKGKDTLINMSNVEYIDSFAIGFLMDIFRKLLDKNLKLIIAGANEKISTLLKITRVNNVVKVYSTIQEAFDAVGKK